ncbi:MAG: flagellar hook-basal body complex protein [Candidatus Eremiobacteraeota bacterium]|nr:flagellar hook-basal body complex protein [Candidatus Eremiobacteraeota bacterium]
MAGFDSLYTGITGLNAYQSWIDMISNNIANVDTTGFKGQMMTFADLFYQNQTFASAPTNTSGGVDGQQLGFGVKVNSVDTLFGQGGLQTTGVNTNLAMNGDGFFILNNLQGSAVPTYTRDGAFQLNSNGVLYDPASGLSVQGWEANNQGIVQYGATGNITIPVGLQMKGSATGTGAKVGPTGDSVFDVALGGNLDQTQWQQAFLNSVGASAANGNVFTVTTTMYDSLGNAHKAQITYVPDATGSVAANITAGGAGTAITAGACIGPNSTISAADPTATTITVTSNGPAANSYTITDTAGNSLTATAGTTVQFDGATLNLVQPAPVAATAQSVTFTAANNGLPASVANASGKGVTPATRWKMEVTFTDGTVFETLKTAGQTNAAGNVTTAPTFGSGQSGTIGFAYFDQNGQFINTSTVETGAAGYQINANTTVAGTPLFHSNGGTPSIDQANLLNVTTWGGGVNNAALPALPGTIALGMWQSNSLAGAFTENAISQNGFGAGTLANFTIGQDGTITGAFTNGQNLTLGQVAVARFANADGLARIGSNQFEQTANSGLAQIGVAGTGTFGTIQSGALEQSNVSLASEFTNLIVAQRAFEANTRGITTADQNLQTVINLRASEN